MLIRIHAEYKNTILYLIIIQYYVSRMVFIVDWKNYCHNNKNFAKTEVDYKEHCKIPLNKQYVQ